MATFDWPGLLRAAIFGRGLSPDEFWALTPVELLTALGLEGGGAPLTRVRLNELLALYPDRKEEMQDVSSRDGRRTGCGKRSDRG